MTSVLVLACETFRHHSTNPLDLAEALARAGLGVTVGAPWDPEARAQAAGRGFATCVVGREGRNAAFWSGALAAARRLRPDVVVGVNAVGFVAADLVRTARLARGLVALPLELQPPSGHARSLSVRWQARRLRTADLVLTTSGARAEAMRELFGLDERPLVVENAPLERPEPSDLLVHRAHAAGLRGRRIVVYAGALGAASCLLEAVEASRLWASDTGLVLVVFGGSDEQRRTLEAAVERSRGRAVLLPPVQGRGALLSLLSGADAALVLYDPEGAGENVQLATPNKLYDALACGLPLVTNPLPGPMSWVLAEGAGATCAPRSPESIAAAVDVLVADLEERRALARALFAEHFEGGRHLDEAVRRVAAL